MIPLIVEPCAVCGGTDFTRVGELGVECNACGHRAYAEAPEALTNLEDLHGPSARLGDWRNDS